MNANQFEKQLKKLKSGLDALKWSKGKSQDEAWQQCERADWMI